MNRIKVEDTLLGWISKIPVKNITQGFSQKKRGGSYYWVKFPTPVKLEGTVMNSPVYIHYGATKFLPTKGFPIKNREYFMKPKGGLWASRKNASFGWKDWCKEEDFRDCDIANSFEFTFAKQAKIVMISTVKQLYNLPRLKNDGLAWGYSIDFEKCLHMGIDAIELCWYGDEYRDVASGDLYYELYGWDCDSIVVLNPDVIIPLYSSKERIKELSCALKSKLVITM